jgi:SAM-dependent methyltransferase
MLSKAKKARRLVGIDIRPRPELLSGNKCVEWIQGKAENKLKDIPDGIVRVVNSDMFVPSFLGEENVDTTAKSLPEIKRVLAENGRFYATTRWG